MIQSPYPHADAAFQSPCLLLQNGSYFFNSFLNSHFGIIDRRQGKHHQEQGAKGHRK